jgi:hypothetical protein
LSVQEKLNIAQAEAEAAALAASVAVAGGTAQHVDGNEPARRAASPRKTKIRGRPRRRKSTLSPDELELLLQTG